MAAVSDYRDSLPPEQVPLYDEAVSRAGRILAAWQADAAHDGPPVTEQAEEDAGEG